MKRAFIMATAALLLVGCATTGAPARAEGDGDVGSPGVSDNTPSNLKHLSYQYASGSQSHPLYDTVWAAMQPTFKGTQGDKNAKFPANPYIGITEIDLNKDKLPEIIAFPVDEVSYGDVYCGKKFLCPHYVLDTSGKQLKSLGVIYAGAVDRGDEIVNGYWTLKAFNKQADLKNFGYYDVYAFNKTTKQYTKQGPAAAPKAKP